MINLQELIGKLTVRYSFEATRYMILLSWQEIANKPGLYRCKILYTLAVKNFPPPSASKFLEYEEVDEGFLEALFLDYRVCLSVTERSNVVTE